MLLNINLKKIYYLGILVSLMYGFAPLVSYIFFGDSLEYLFEYTVYYALCALIVGYISFPKFNTVSFVVNCNCITLRAICISSIIFFIVMQIHVHGDFSAAFVSSYTERMGTEVGGFLRYIYYPILSLFTASVFLLTLCDKIRSNYVNILICGFSVFIVSALGSRNILLWIFSGALVINFSGRRYYVLTFFVFILYIFAVIFAFVRNTGLIDLMIGSGVVQGNLSFEYFNPIIHEFGSAYRAFEIVSNNQFTTDLADHSPYGQLSSLFINQLPSFLKPADFISFTEFISLRYGVNGEGLGSSPMTELTTSNFLSIISLILLCIIFFLPVKARFGLVRVRLFTICLYPALYMNIWRIGSPEILKMFLSFLVVSLLVSILSNLTVYQLKSTV